jgi:Protein kinase domain
MVTTSKKHDHKSSNPVIMSTNNNTLRPPDVNGVTGLTADDDDSPVVATFPPSPESSSHSHSSFVTTSSSSIASLTGPSSMTSGSRLPAAPVVIQDLDNEDEREMNRVVDINDSPLGGSSPGSRESQFLTDDVPKTTEDTSFVDFDDDDDDELGVLTTVVSPLDPVNPEHGRPFIQLDGLLGIHSLSDSGTSTVDNVLNSWSRDLETISPVPRYRGWLSEILVPLEEFIDDRVEPRDRYVDLKEIAEGEFGYVYAARVNRLLPVLSPRGGDVERNADEFVAIKAVPILPTGSPKLDDLKRELNLLRNVKHPHVLTMDGLYVDLVEDSLWIRMELMERSLADMVTLVDEGIFIPEKVIARFAGDVSKSSYLLFFFLAYFFFRLQIVLALIYLQKLGIAHRDLRSDNLLLNKDGVLKIGPPRLRLFCLTIQDHA